MASALALGEGMIAEGAAALDVCEAVVRSLEDNPMFNAGKGAVFNEKGEHELDAWHHAKAFKVKAGREISENKKRAAAALA